jgi:hypothetical protein
MLKTQALPKHAERNRIQEAKAPAVYDALKVSLATLSGIPKDRGAALENVLRAHSLSSMASASASQLQACSTGHQAKKIHTFFNPNV